MRWHRGGNRDNNCENCGAYHRSSTRSCDETDAGGADFMRPDVARPEVLAVWLSSPATSDGVRDVLYTAAQIS